MSIRIGFDMDGVVADFASAYREIERKLFKGAGPGRPDEPEREEEAREQRVRRATGDHADAPGETPAESHPPHEMRRRRDLVWKEIERTPNFWATLRPIEEGGVARIHTLMLRYRWEVFFITQRPPTEGETVQRQSQQWLVRQGFDLPSVLVIGGSRGAAAAALRLTYHVDDSPQNCMDVRSQSTARPVLIVPGNDAASIASARKLGIASAASLSLCLDLLEKASAAQSQPGMLDRLAALVGWKTKN